LSFLILINILKVSAEIKRIDLIYTAIFHIPIMSIVYLNLQVLIPYFLEKGKYFFYGVLIIASIALGSVFYIVLFDYWVDFIFSGYYFIAYYSFWDISLYFAIFLLLTSLFRLARGWFRLQEAEKEKTLAELKALKSQINPHFLFNSLNSIYSLSRKKSDLVPQKIVQLSDLMRHIIYDSEADYILLEKEIEMIKNYIELQNLRIHENEKIELNVSGEIKNHKIAPLLFLPFVENSFKHGLKSGVDDAFVKINIENTGHVIYFKIENRFGNTRQISDNSYAGIGIENVKKRLKLLYPGQHLLKISKNQQTFRVVLQVQLK
jgi:sensor histidine kinase YesM